MNKEKNILKEIIIPIIVAVSISIVAAISSSYLLIQRHGNDIDTLKVSVSENKTSFENIKYDITRTRERIISIETKLDMLIERQNKKV